MQSTTCSQLDDETSAWCARAEQAAGSAPGGVSACLELVRAGILLRRRWDLVDRDAPQRRRLLGLLAAAQTVCHQKLADTLADAPAAQTGPKSELASRLSHRLVEDDRYLADLLNDHTLPPESVGFAVECFRDDLHWLGTLAALLDGNRGIDFTGRVLLEQESLQRMLESWQPETAPAGSPTAVSDELRESARQLRTTALARQAESLLSQSEPRDAEGWYRSWQVASRLSMRPKGATAADLEEAVYKYQARAAERWSESLASLSSSDRDAALHQAVDELADAASETLTFLEDLPLAEAVRSLEILAEDAAICQEALRRHGDSETKDLGRRLRRRRQAVAAELQERRLGWRMERLFGHRAVAALEHLILVLLVLFVVLLAVEEPLIRYERTRWPGSIVVETTCAWLDLGICLVFLAEFSLKWFLSTPRRMYFARHWITGLLPAIPVGFIAYITHPDRANLEMAGELFVLLRALRYLRLPQMARWLRIARPVLRIVRLVGFVMQASDRLARRLAPLLNRNLVLFERAAIKAEEPVYRVELAALRERFRYRASELIAGLPPPACRELVHARIEDLGVMLSGPCVGPVVPAAKAEPSTAREIPLEQIIARLLAATPAGISERIGRTLAQSVARWCQAFDVFGVRRLPVVRDLVAAGRRSSPYGTTAEVANRIGSLLRHMLDRVYWVADLYGTLTAPQLVDSIGDWMVKGTARPARRFLMIGAAFLVVFFLAGLLPYGPLQQLTDSLKRLVAAPLMVLGVLCLIPLFIGLWFRQIAGEASDFCTQVAEAQFITATKQLKRRFAKRHHAVLYHRVIAPEAEISGHAALRPAGSEGAHQEDSPSQRARAAVELLFDDYLDGAPFHRSDTKTSTQLLGNLALVSLREARLGYRRRRRKRLRRLDLATTRSWLRGPYLWFHFISRSLAQQTARLVVDYNAHALPLDRAATADPEQIRRYLGWLSRRLNRPVDQLDLPAEFRGRLGAGAQQAGGSGQAKEDRCGREFQGNEFTAIHFLSADPQLEADVRRRYGDQVAELMHRDRRDNIRRVFRTYPFHQWPREQRTFNPLVLYDRYLAGGLVLLLPFRALWGAAKLSVQALRLLCKFVAEVLDPAAGEVEAVEEPDPLAVAVRKIHRMRKPVFLECLGMRAEFDPEYLGLSLPGSTAYARQATTTPIEEDLTLIGADPGVLREFRRLASDRRRQILEFRRLLADFDAGEQSGESLRAMAIAYAINYQHARTRLEASQRLKRAFDEAPANPSGPGWSLAALWCRCRYAARMNRLLRQPTFQHYAGQQRACLGLLCRRRGRLLRDFHRLTRRGAPADPAGAARQVLLAVARDPATWSRQLVILRAVQTLSVLDLRTYCDLVAELGEYDTCPAGTADGMVPSE